MRELIDRDDAIEKFQSKCDEIMQRVLTDDALPIVVTQSMRREVHMLKQCIAALRSLPAAEKGEGPLAIYAKHEGEWNWWLWDSTPRPCWTRGLYSNLGSSDFDEVDRERSYPEALRLYDQDNHASPAPPAEGDNSGGGGR